MWQFCIFLFFFFFFYFLAPWVSSLHGQCSKSQREGNLPLWLKELWFQKNGANPIAFFLPLLFCCLALMRAQSWETHCRVVLMRPWLSYGRLEKGNPRVIKSEQWGIWEIDCLQFLVDIWAMQVWIWPYTTYININDNWIMSLTTSGSRLETGNCMGSYETYCIWLQRHCKLN